MTNLQSALVDTRRWLERAVVGLNLCPFAKAVLVKGQVHFAATPADEPAGILDAFGHISVRNPNNPHRYFLSRSRAPGLVQADDIRESVRIILDTNPGERVMCPDFGAGLQALAFEPISAATSALVRHRHIDHAVAACKHDCARIAGRNPFHSRADDRGFRPQQGNRLSLHICAHESAVGVIMFKEGNQRCSH